MPPRLPLAAHANTLREDAARLEVLSAELEDLAASLQVEGSADPVLAAQLHDQSGRSRQAASDLYRAADRLVPDRRAEGPAARYRHGLPAVAVLLLAVAAGRALRRWSRSH